MRISHLHKFIFLSRYKCASTSIRRALDPFSDIKSSQSPPYYHHGSLADLEVHLREMGFSLEEYFVFTTIRHPVAMLGSLYDYGFPDRGGRYWWERHWDRVSNNVAVPLAERATDDLAPFREWVLEHDLTRFTADPFVRDASGAVRADRVLRTEALETEFSEVAEKLGLGRLQAPRLNTGPGLDHEFDAAMLQHVRAAFKTDAILGGYVI